MMLTYAIPMAHVHFQKQTVLSRATSNRHQHHHLNLTTTTVMLKKATTLKRTNPRLKMMILKSSKSKPRWQPVLAVAAAAAGVHKCTVKRPN